MHHNSFSRSNPFKTSTKIPRFFYNLVYIVLIFSSVLTEIKKFRITLTSVEPLKISLWNLSWQNCRGFRTDHQSHSNKNLVILGHMTQQQTLHTMWDPNSKRSKFYYNDANSQVDSLGFICSRTCLDGLIFGGFIFSK